MLNDITRSSIGSADASAAATHHIDTKKATIADSRAN
jgi:hypothetical protein